MEINEKITLTNRVGLHLRAASEFIKVSGRFKCAIQAGYRGQSVDAKSIIGLMMLGAPGGAEVTLTFRGDDADSACEAVRGLVREKFLEKE